MSFFTEDLIAAAKLSEFFPTGQTTFSDPADLITFANQELQIKLVPQIMSVRQDIFRQRKLVTIQTGLNHYAIPERAIGNAFKDLWLVPDATQLYNKKPLPKIQEHQEDLYDAASGTPQAFDLEGDEVFLLPTPASGSGSLLFSYFERPNQIVSTSSCAKITAISTVGATTTFTVDTDLTASLVSASKLDILAVTSPFRLWAKDVPITTITSTTIAVALSNIQDEVLNTLPQVGDYLCPAQQTCIPMIAQEFHPILSEMIAARALKALGATAKLQSCNANIKDMLMGAIKIIENRVESAPDVVMPRNGLLAALGRGFGSSVR